MLLCRLGAAVFATATSFLAYPTAAIAASMPQIVNEHGRHALMVDDKPFLMLGAQVHNSSNYPDMLPKVWPTIHALNVNTLEMPIAWEQIEPVEGQFDFSFVDTLVRQARENNVHLVLLWFGTWKNSGPTYTPEWVKSDTHRFIRMKTREGKTHFSLSPLGRPTLEADKKAFVQLMTHIREIDAQHTVIMVQVENEVGAGGIARDFSAQANRLFDGAVPDALVKSVHAQPGTWSQVFGQRADQAFNAWYTARYVDEIAAAGKQVLDLPMYCNAALTNPFKPESASGGASGGPNWNVIDIWKAAAPHINLVAPDIYSRDPAFYAAYLNDYTRADNPLMVPETGNASEFARFFWPALGHGAIGFSPFGMDGTSYSNFPLGAEKLDADTLDAFAEPYALFKPIEGDWAQIAFNHPTWGVAKGADNSDQSTTMGRWKITAQFGRWQMKELSDPRNKPNPTATQPVGGAVVAQLGPDEFLVAGTKMRLRFDAADGENWQFLSVEEGTFVDGKWTMRRRWNGDQIDFGLNFVEPVLLKVRIATYN